MATQLEIRESSDSLVAMVRRDAHIGERILETAIAGVVLAVVSGYFLSGQWRLSLAVLAGLVVFVASSRTKRVKLRVTKVDFETRANFGISLRLGQAVCVTDIRWLEYRVDASGPDATDQPEGLYAVKSRGLACLLPFVSESDANKLIAAIERKFPVMAERWRSESAFGTNFLSLGIGETK